MEDTDLATATQVANRLLATLAAPIEIDGHLHVVRASIGLAEAVPGRSNGTDTMRNADVAVDMAKERGKSSLAIYDPAWHRHAVETFAVRQELEIAIATDQLTLVYQPIVTLDTHTISGFEALVRWDHPERGLLSPDVFIPLAEQSGLIVPLDDWVLRAAVLGCASLQTEDHRPSIAVNVSAKQLSQPGFDGIVLATLADAQLPADRLVLEVTESALLDELDAGVKALVELRAPWRPGGHRRLRHRLQLPVAPGPPPGGPAQGGQVLHRPAATQRPGRACSCRRSWPPHRACDCSPSPRASRTHTRPGGFTRPAATWARGSCGRGRSTSRRPGTCPRACPAT